MPLEKLHNEEELIFLTSKGDENAFSKLYYYYRNTIYTIVFKLTQSATIAEEVVGDVFLKIWSKKSALNEIENFRAYLFAIARNETYKILKQISKNYKFTLHTDKNESITCNNSEDYLIGKEYNTLLKKAIDSLPHQQKQVYQLMKEGELKRTEVADLLHLAPETVKSHLAQAMKNIRAFCLMHLSTFATLIVLTLLT